MFAVCCTNAAYQSDVQSKKEKSGDKKGEKLGDAAYVAEWLWKENRTSLINTVLMFSSTLLLPNKEICSRDSFKYLQMKAYINNPSIKFIKRPYIK